MPFALFPLVGEPEDICLRGGKAVGHVASRSQVTRAPCRTPSCSTNSGISAEPSRDEHDEHPTHTGRST